MPHSTQSGTITHKISRNKSKNATPGNRLAFSGKAPSIVGLEGRNALSGSRVKSRTGGFAALVLESLVFSFFLPMIMWRPCGDHVGTDAFVRPCGPGVSGRSVSFARFGTRPPLLGSPTSCAAGCNLSLLRSCYFFDTLWSLGVGGEVEAGAADVAHGGVEGVEDRFSAAKLWRSTPGKTFSPAPTNKGTSNSKTFAVRSATS